VSARGAAVAEIDDRSARGRIERVETRTTGQSGAAQLGGAASFGGEHYPAASSPLCIVLRVVVNGQSKVIGYYSLDGTWHAVGV